MEKTARHTVIDWGVLIEHSINEILASLLGIDDIPTSKSFGFASTSLPFSQKLNLLFDLKSLEKEDKIKFELFSQIRNQFAHNIEVNDFSKCVDRIDGLENKLRKYYPSIFIESKTREEILNISFDLLIMELFVAFKKLHDHIAKREFDKGFIDGTLDAYKFIYEALERSVEEITNYLPTGDLIKQAIFLKTLKLIQEQNQLLEE